MTSSAGGPNGLAEGFTVPHDTSHVLSSYTTSAQGELLVSTFIGAMHPDHPMSAEVLPVLFSWHLGVALNKIAGSWRGAYEPQVLDRLGPRRGDQRRRAQPRLGLLGGNRMATWRPPARTRRDPHRPHPGRLSSGTVALAP